MEQTLAIIKPDGVGAGLIGEIIRRIENEGLRIAGMRMAQLNDREAEGFYYVHREKPFFKDLVAYMTSGPVVLMVLSGVDVINRWRTLMGATDPKRAATTAKAVGLNMAPSISVKLSSGKNTSMIIILAEKRCVPTS